MSTCPNKDLLSAYIDGELTSPWKENIEQHLQECTTCKNIYNSYTLVQRCMQAAASAHTLDSAESFAKLCAKRDAVLKRKLQTRNAQSGAAARRGRWFFSSIRVPAPAAAAALLLFVLTPVVLFLKTESAASSVAAAGSSFTPILPVSLEKQKPIAAVDYGILQVNAGHTYAVANKAVNANAKLFTVGEFARLYSKNENVFAPAQSTVNLKISSSSFPFSTGYQPLYSITDADTHAIISNR